jgi:uncharacterized protein (TIGR02117 family)
MSLAFLQRVAAPTRHLRLEGRGHVPVKEPCVTTLVQALREMLARAAPRPPGSRRLPVSVTGGRGRRSAGFGGAVTCALAFAFLASGCVEPAPVTAAHAGGNSPVVARLAGPAGVAGVAGAGVAGVAEAAEAAEPMRRIQVVNHGLHSGLVVRAADLPGCAWPARCAFSDAEYLEVGWGDRAYYQAVDPPLWFGLRALFWPTPSVLHMAAFNGPAALRFPSLEVIELEVTARGLDRLVAAIASSHEREPEGRPIDLGPGLYGPSRFYAARESFHLFRTCNAWTATMLREAGVAIQAPFVLTSDGLFRRLRPLAAPVPAPPSASGQRP